MAWMSAESKFQNHIYENEGEARNQAIAQLSTWAAETVAVLPTTIKPI